jgi:hypothetical protein
MIGSTAASSSWNFAHAPAGIVLTPYFGMLLSSVMTTSWLFSDSVKGVKASANLYSVIETAKANGLEPYAYLRYMFTALPKADTVEAIEALLPGNLEKDQINAR